jgi:hypothetical protein
LCTSRVSGWYAAAAQTTPSITSARMRQIELDELTQREFDMITNKQFTDTVHDESPTGCPDVKQKKRTVASFHANTKVDLHIHPIL